MKKIAALLLGSAMVTTCLCSCANTNSGTTSAVQTAAISVAATSSLDDITSVASSPESSDTTTSKASLTESTAASKTSSTAAKLSQSKSSASQSSKPSATSSAKASSAAPKSSVAASSASPKSSVASSSSSTKSSVAASSQASASSATAVSSNILQSGLSAAQVAQVQQRFIDDMKGRTDIGGHVSINTDSALYQTAQIRSAEVLTKFSHTRPDGTDCFTAFTQTNCNYRQAGENLAYASYYPLSLPTNVDDIADWMFQGLCNDPPHLENMQNTVFENVGVSVSSCVKDGQIYVSVAQDYTAPKL